MKVASVAALLASAASMATWAPAARAIPLDVEAAELSLRAAWPNATDEAAAPLASRALSVTDLGCYSDSVSSRALATRAYADASNTRGRCQQTCADRGFQYAGVEYATECWCDNAIRSPSVRVANQGDCNAKCSGSTELCGGGNRINVFRVANVAAAGPTIPPSSGGYNYKGCYTDSVSARTLTDFYASSPARTVDGCITTCKSRGFTVAGLEYGAECLCGNAVSLGATKTPDADCNMRCTGNAANSCGAGNRLQVYSSLATLPSAARFPAPPNGATLLQFAGCANTAATVPMFVSDAAGFNGQTSSATVAFVVTHGAGRDFQNSFPSLWPNVISGSANLLIAPNFYVNTDRPTVTNGVASNWYRPDSNLAWASGAHTWEAGDDAVSPAGVPACSSYDVYDKLLATLLDKSKFPNLSRVQFLGHSGGAGFTGHYALASSAAASSSLPVSFVAANWAEQAWLGNVRADRSTTPASCADAYNWPYGFNNLNRYAAARIPNAADAFRSWVGKDLTLLTGQLDTYARFSFGDTSCGAQAQGGINRRDRGYAHWAYINLISGTGRDVSKYYAYADLVAQSPAVLSPKPAAFRARQCNMPNVGHIDANVWSSPCGRAAIFKTPLPAEGSPDRP